MHKKNSAHSPFLNSAKESLTHSPGKHHPKQKVAWRKNVILCAIATVAVIGTNIAILIWTRISFPAGDGGATEIYAGSCATSKRTKLWVDLAVNILSTLLLAASNYCMQVLTSPTRTETDKAHSRGKWVDIGVPSIRNLSKVSGWRVVLWTMLAMSSIPLHLFYNSVFFNTLAANDYEAALVTHDFVSGGWWNETRVTNSLKKKAYGESSKWYAMEPSWGKHGYKFSWLDKWVTQYPEQLHYMQDNIDRLQRLDNKECLRAYGTSLFESAWRNVLVVGNITSLDNVVKVWIHSPIDGETDEEWVCQGTDSYHDRQWGTPWNTVSCDVDALMEDSSTWSIPDVRLCNNDNQAVDQCPMGSVKVDYCLAEPSTQHCTVQINTYLLVVVIVCNLLKLIAMIFTAFSRDFEPLANIGDAAVSFLNCPEEQTRNVGPLSIIDVRSKRRDVSSRPFRRRARRWAAAVSIWRWIACSILFLGLLAGGLALFFCARATTGESLSQMLNQGIGSVSVSNLVGSPDSNERDETSFLPGVLLANTPQLFVSVADLLYNNIFTCMLLAYEWGSFSTDRKGLRVSRKVPESAQRATFKLQLPYRYVLPMKSIMPVLHWLVASSIFYLQLMPYDVGGTPLPKAQIAACAYSPAAIFYAVCLGGLLILILFCFSMFSLPSGIPVAGYCSLAISAACHPGANENDVTLQRLQYGVVEHVEADKLGRETVGFSSREVRPLVNGAMYL